MTTLAKPNQIHPVVCFILGRKLAERRPVMDRETVSNVLFAMSALASLFFYDQSASPKPTPAAICAWTPYPIRGVFIALMNVAKVVSALFRAKLAATCICSVRSVRRPFKWLTTVFANMNDVNHKSLASHLLRSKPTRVVGRRFANGVHPGNILLTQTRTGTKTLSEKLRRLNHHNSAAPFATLRSLLVCAHSDNMAAIPRFASSGTTGMVAPELGRKAILIELNPEYVEMAKRRCDVTPWLPGL